MWLFGHRMNSTILLLLVTITYGARSPCENNCRIPFQDQVSVSRAVLEYSEYCKCFEKYIQWLKTYKPQRKLAKLNEKQADIVYYKPTKNVNVQNLQLVHPFYFTINPAILPSYYDNQVPTNIIPNWTYQPYQFENSYNVPSTSTKIKRKESDTNLNVDTNYAPLYFDINLNQSNDNKQKDLTDVYQNKIKYVSEKNIKDCFDLHVIIYSRNESINIRLDNMSSERNNKYNNLPFSDLIVEINNKCNELETIVGESFNEIKIKHSFSRNSNIISRNNKQLHEVSKTAEEDGLQDQSKSQVLDHNLNKFKSLETEPNLETSTVEGPVIQPNMTRNNKLKLEKNSKFMNDSFRQTWFNDSANDTTPYLFHKKMTTFPNFELNVQSTTADLSQETTVLDIEEITHLDAMADSLPRLSVLNTTPTAQNNETSMNPGEVTKINVNKHLTTAAVDDAEPITTSNIPTESATVIYEPVQDENITVSIQNKHELLIFDNITNYTDLDNTTTDNATNRSKYSEGEYVIPKVVTTELSNDTIISELLKNENIPNLDFVELADDVNLPERKFSETSTITDQWDKNNENFTNFLMQKENLSPPLKRKDDINNIVDDTNADQSSITDISGKLYFKYGPDYVPASFVQEPDGQVNVALDILSLCKSNKIEKSKLIQAICNCI